MLGQLVGLVPLSDVLVDLAWVVALNVGLVADLALEAWRDRARVLPLQGLVDENVGVWVRCVFLGVIDVWIEYVFWHSNCMGRK